MAVATPEPYAEMLDAAKEGGFAYPAINFTSSSTINSAIRAWGRPGPTASCRSRVVAPTHRRPDRQGAVSGGLGLAAFANEVAKTSAS